MGKNQKITVSETGIIHGIGTAPYKYVSGLTDVERAAVRGGDLVFIRNNSAHHYTQSGWKVVKFRFGKYFHREPSAVQVAAFNRFFNRVD